MATSSRVTVEKVTVQQIPGIRLELTIPEAETLAAILGFVGGSPEKSPRGNANSILEALTKSEISYYRTDDRKLITGALRFKNYPEFQEEEEDCSL